MDHSPQVRQRFPGHAVEPLIGLPAVRRPLPGEASSAGPADHADPMAVSGVLDDSDTPVDVIDLLALEAFSTGRQPFARTRQVHDVLTTAALLPPGARLLRDAGDDEQRSQLAVGEGWTIRAVRWKRSRRASVTVTAETAELAETQLGLAFKDAVAAPTRPVLGRVPIGFWHQTARGPRRVPRDIETADWSRIRGNYSEQVATALEPLMSLTPAGVNGRLLLLHGPPGTGKTTLLRALARQWRTWCQVDCVLDPEQLFADSSYLLDVALGHIHDDDDDDDGGGGGGAKAWRLLLLEDCDELIRGEAKSSTGQQLSRLLNLTDGLLGQGRNVLVAITTNENLAALHPAVVRPGRSLAHLEVGRLSQAEATVWLANAQAGRAGAVGGETAGGPGGGTHPVGTVGAGGATLAELFALSSGAVASSSVDPAPGTGLYL